MAKSDVVNMFLLSSFYHGTILKKTMFHDHAAHSNSSVQGPPLCNLLSKCPDRSSSRNQSPFLCAAPPSSSPSYQTMRVTCFSLLSHDRRLSLDKLLRAKIAARWYPTAKCVFTRDSIHVMHKLWVARQLLLPPAPSATHDTHRHACMGVHILGQQGILPLAEEYIPTNLRKCFFKHKQIFSWHHIHDRT